MDPDSRSEDYSPPARYIQPFECSQQVTSSSSVPSYEDSDQAQAGELLQSTSLLSSVEPGSFVQLSASTLSQSAVQVLQQAAPQPPPQLLNKAVAAANIEDNHEASDLIKRKSNAEWLPPTPVDSDNSPSPSSEENGLPRKRTKFIPPAPSFEIVASLLDADLWNSFKRVGNEMIVTKPGRRFFPTLLVGLRGLQQHTDYDIILRVMSVDSYRYKFMNMKWIAVGESEILQDEKRQMYRHPNSPKPGYFWMKKPISFKPCKISHDPRSKHGDILLHTMHKYVLELQITPLQSNDKPICIRLDATEFVAVSAYQNTNLTQLKIDNNPFAKGFRDREIVPATSFPAFHHPQYRPPTLDTPLPLPALPNVPYRF